MSDDQPPDPRRVRGAIFSRQLQCTDGLFESLEDLEMAGGLRTISDEVRPWMPMRLAVALDSTRKAIAGQLEQIGGIRPGPPMPVASGAGDFPPTSTASKRPVRHPVREGKSPGGQGSPPRDAKRAPRSRRPGGPTDDATLRPTPGRGSPRSGEAVRIRGCSRRPPGGPSGLLAMARGPWRTSGVGLHTPRPLRVLSRHRTFSLISEPSEIYCPKRSSLH